MPALSSSQTNLEVQSSTLCQSAINLLRDEGYKQGHELDHNRMIKLGTPLLRGLRRYHHHEIVGMNLIPKSGPVLLAVNHSLATYDIFLLLLAIYEDINRVPRPLADHLFFKIPFLGELIKFFGAVKGNPRNARALLNAGELVAVAPGGMREALRPSTQKHQIRWKERSGFARLAIEAQSPVILAACPNADEMYHVYPSHLTDWFYKTYKIPFFFARGWKNSPMPKPIKLVHYISKPIHPPSLPKSGIIDNSLIAKYHSKLTIEMTKLIESSVQRERKQEKSSR